MLSGDYINILSLPLYYPPLVDFIFIFLCRYNPFFVQ